MYLGNNLYTTLASGIDNDDLALSVSTGEGAQFGTEITRLYGSEKYPYYLTIWSASYSSPSLDSGMEIVEVTARDTDDFTIVRGQRGTSASAHSSGDKVIMGNYADDLVWDSLPAKEYVDNAGRYVALDPGVVVVNGADPSSTGFTDVDCTAATSATCYAVNCVVGFNASTVARIFYVRKNGSADSGNTAVAATLNVANQYTWVPFTVGVDGDQIFEYAVSNVDVSAVYIYVHGYWETI
jgi:hypothetical protein